MKLQGLPGATQECWCGQPWGSVAQNTNPVFTKSPKDSFWGSSNPPLLLLRVMPRLYSYFTSLHGLEKPKEEYRALWLSTQLKVGARPGEENQTSEECLSSLPTDTQNGEHAHTQFPLLLLYPILVHQAEFRYFLLQLISLETCLL